jgi:hypothetical protein
MLLQPLCLLRGSNGDACEKKGSNIKKEERTEGQRPKQNVNDIHMVESKLLACLLRSYRYNNDYD